MAGGKSASTSKPTSMPIRIMLVDDHEIVRAGVKAKLRDAHYVIVGEASHGSEAVQRASQCNPDLIVMDVRMPIMDGFTATKMIKANMPLIRILILTSENTKDLVDCAIASGADGFCHKDATAEILRGAISAIHGGVPFKNWGGGER